MLQMFVINSVPPHALLVFSWLRTFLISASVKFTESLSEGDGISCIIAATVVSTIFGTSDQNFHSSNTSKGLRKKSPKPRKFLLGRAEYAH